MKTLKDLLITHFGNKIEVHDANHYGIANNALEANSFAYLAYRVQRGLPISFPKTTGVAEPLCGGILFRNIDQKLHAEC